MIPEFIIGFFAGSIITLAVIIGLAFWFEKKKEIKRGREGGKHEFKNCNY